MAGLTLRLDRVRWSEHLRSVATGTPGLVPVIKGHGYGYGIGWLADQAADLGVDTVAVGMVTEVAAVRDRFPGSIVVLNPFDPRSPLARELAQDPRVITTVSRLDDLLGLAQGEGRPRVVVEVLTSMRRHGLGVTDLPAVAGCGDGVDVQGWTVHLPLRAVGRLAEADRLGRAALAVVAAPLWLSHLPVTDAVGLAGRLAAAGADPVPLRLRVGTRLWLGDPSSRTTTASVLDVHPVRRGQRTGYRQRVCPADGWVVVVAGGTSHGVGMEAPTAAVSVRQRATALATGSLAAAGLALSPFTVNGKKRWFLEPPHMQSSLIFLPSSENPPAVGAEVPVELRLTTAVVDQILLS